VRFEGGGSRPRLTYADVTQPKVPTPVPPMETLPNPEPPHQSNTSRSSRPSGEQLTAWNSPLFPPSAQALRQVQPRPANGSALEGRSPSSPTSSCGHRRISFPQPAVANRAQRNFPQSQYQQRGPSSASPARPPYEIKAASIIPAALITGLNSDLPGQIVGRYNADIGYGQDRLQIVWDWLIMPNGVRLESMVRTDKPVLPASKIRSTTTFRAWSAPCCSPRSSAPMAASSTTSATPRPSKPPPSTPTVGTIAAFQVPEAAKRYKASIGGDVHDDFPFMKPIVTGPGDHVCNNADEGLLINGEPVLSAPSQRGPSGVIPFWEACRRLARNTPGASTAESMVP
jgi:hypothetical protein